MTKLRHRTLLNVKSASLIFMESRDKAPKDAPIDGKLSFIKRAPLTLKSQISLIDTLNIEIEYEGEIRHIENFDLGHILEDIAKPGYREIML